MIYSPNHLTLKKLIFFSHINHVLFCLYLSVLFSLAACVVCNSSDISIYGNGVSVE